MTGRSSPTDAATRMADALRPFQQRETGGDMPGRPQTGIHARILIDRSPTMAVWRDDLDAFARALIGLGAFRSVQIGDLPAAAEAQAWAASPGTIATAGAGGTDVHRVLILVSDCAAPGGAVRRGGRVCTPSCTAPPQHSSIPCPRNSGATSGSICRPSASKRPRHQRRATPTSSSSRRPS